MKSLLFKSLHLLSEREKKARSLEFHPKRNLILGLNHVGKSTVTKQIFETLGAIPFGKLEHWDTAAAILLKLEIDGQEFSVVRQHSNRAMFNSSGELIACASRLGDWNRFFSELAEFNLVLTSKGDSTSLADAACMFLPFYINQDGGWSGNWRSFQGLSRFKNPAKAILEYFTQILPPSYYVARAAYEAEQRSITSIDADIRILDRTRERLSKSLSPVNPQLSIEGFEAEIREITRQLTILNSSQESLRSQIARLQDGILSADQQIALTTQSLQRFGEDFKYLAQPTRREMICPTCGAEHEESFLETLNFAEDARILSETMIQLQHSRDELRSRLEEKMKEHSSLSAKYDELQAILDVRRGEVKLRDVVTSMGSGAALQAFDQEDRELESLRSEHLSGRHKFELDMKAIRSAKRKKAILKAFREHYSSARTRLNLMSVDTKKLQVSSRPDASGSGGPRDVLAYYAALWWVSREPSFGSPFSVPIVVDCPAQSGQDAKNLPAMIDFISTGLPSGAQIFMTFESDVTHEFDKRIALDTPFSMLREDEFERESEIVVPMLLEMQKSLVQKSLTISP